MASGSSFSSRHLPTPAGKSLLKPCFLLVSISCPRSILSPCPLRASVSCPGAPLLLHLVLAPVSFPRSLLLPCLVPTFISCFGSPTLFSPCPVPALATVKSRALLMPRSVSALADS